MRICCAFLACLLLVGIPCMIYGQQGNARSTKGPNTKVANPAKTGQKTSEPGRSDGAVTPISHTDSQTSLELQKTPRDEIEVDLQSVVEKMASAGLIDESNQVRTILQRIRDQHHDKQPDVEKKVVSNAQKSEIGLTVTWFEINEDSPAIESIKQLFTDVQREGESDDAPWRGTASGALSAEKIAQLFELHNQGHVKLIRQQRGILLDGCKDLFIQGSAVDILASRTEGKIIHLATTEDYSATTQEIAEMLRRPNVVLDGSAIRAHAEVQDEHMIKLSVTAQLSNVPPIKSKGDSPTSQTRRIQTVIEVKDGQSLAMFGLQSPRNVVESNRVPVLGDIPGLGPRFFSSKKIRTEQPYLLCLITPKILPQVDEALKSSDAGESGFHPPLRDQRKSDGISPTRVKGFGTTAQ